MSNHTPYRQLVAGLAAMGAVTLRGQEYKGEYLSTVLAVNPEQPGEEASRTGQLIAEFGRLAAASLRDKEMLEVDYRIWREGTVHEIVTDIEAAINMGALPEGATKPISKTAAESFIHTLPEYAEHKRLVADAEEVWGTMHATFEAAKARQYAIRAFESSGGTATRDHRDGGSSHRGHGESTDRANDPESANHYHPGYQDSNRGPQRSEPIAAAESRLDDAPRSPIPPPKPTSGPPGPPPKPSPPPPPRSAS